jgi:2-amino-4-hydroxy-6-hydroxymethyldihydropteridine diphosphokinase
MIYLLLGTNIGDIKKNIVDAKEKLSIALNKKGLRTGLIESEFLITKALGFIGDDFLNQVVAFDLEILPEDLLDICQKIEIEMGRGIHLPQYNEDGSRKYESRIIDIDILLFNDEKISTKRLTVPHPQIEQRGFVKELMNNLKYDTRRSI